MPHPLVAQLHFTRREWLRALEGVSDADARRRFLPMNCLSWMIGHLASHEHYCWVQAAQHKNILQEVDALVAYEQPASTPPLADMWAAWQAVTRAADEYLGTLTTSSLQTFLLVDGKPADENVGTMLQRLIYHYWYHLGESQAVRQLLGHTNLPEFVGDIQLDAPYCPEDGPK
jgi:hypothetical protein